MNICIKHLESFQAQLIFVIDGFQQYKRVMTTTMSSRTRTLNFHNN